MEIIIMVITDEDYEALLRYLAGQEDFELETTAA